MAKARRRFHILEDKILRDIFFIGNITDPRDPRGRRIGRRTVVINLLDDERTRAAMSRQTLAAGSTDGLSLKLWELDDDELEAELQRQLDGLDDADDLGIEDGGAEGPPALALAAAPVLPEHAAGKTALPPGDENTAHSANSLGVAMWTLMADLKPWMRRRPRLASRIAGTMPVVALQHGHSLWPP